MAKLAGAMKGHVRFVGGHVGYHESDVRARTCRNLAALAWSEWQKRSMTGR